MHSILSCFLIFLQIINIIIFYKLFRMKRTIIIKRIADTIIGMVCVIAAEIVILFAKDRQLAYCAFTFYYIAFMWYVMMIFRFSVVYCGLKEKKLYKTPIFWITIAETVVLVWGMFSKSFFLITHAKWYGHIYWISRVFPIFYIFAAIIGIALAAALVMLVVAAVKSARIYRLKFVSIIAVLSVMALCRFISQINQQPILVQVIILALCELIIIYMAVYYAPRKLNQRAMRFVADKLNDGIVLYDDEHQLQLVTEGYRDAFGVTNLQELANEELYWKKMFSEANEENAWNGSVKSVVRDGEKFYYEIQHLALNEDNKLIGTVYWIRNVTEAIENYRSMVQRANFDEITGIYNEAHFHESAKKVLEANPDTTFVMTCSSIEKHRFFKELFGQQKYDDYLIKTAETLKRGLANFPNCRYGKIGESDFYVMMPKEFFAPDQLTGAIDSVAKLFSTNNFDLNVKAGVYEIKETSFNMLAICNKASMACEAIKGDYGKKLLWFDEKTQSEFMKKERYNAELSNAIENGEIQIYLQPQIDINGKLIGAEALARWIHKEEGFLSPAQFIPHFEKNGRITELDICVWRQACAKLKEWKSIGRDDLYISVNISPKDLYALDIYEFHVNLVKEYGIAAKNLKLEITESAIINDLKQHISLVEKLQEVGFEVEMDDFGSAYSSFNMLKDICVDALKIDMKFLGETENEERSHAILKSIVDLSKKLNMKTIAEGVETEQQLQFLRSVNCDIYQGYYFAKPMSIADFESKYLQAAE